MCLAGIRICVMNELLLLIHGKSRAVMELAVKLDRIPKRFGTDESLSASEIHLVEVIGDTEDLSVTDIANFFGITKGAVSQSLKRLDAKGYVTKKQDPANLSRNIIELTPKGKTAYWAHKDWHQKMDGGFAEYLQELSDDELQIVATFLGKTEDFLERRIRSLK